MTEQHDIIAALTAALERYTNADECEYGDAPPCPGDGGMQQCMYCQACGALTLAREDV